MTDHIQVHPGELATGAGELGTLVGHCETATEGLASTLMELQNAAGHPGLAAALGGANESATQTMLSVGKVLAFIGEGLSSSAKEYAATEAANTKKLNSIHRTAN